MVFVGEYLVLQILAFAIFVLAIVRKEILLTAVAFISFAALWATGGLMEFQFCEYQEAPGTPDNFTCHTETFTDHLAINHNMAMTFISLVLLVARAFQLLQDPRRANI